MRRFFSFFTDHPWIIAGGVIFLIVIMWFSGRGSSSSPAGVVVVGPDSAAMQAAAAADAIKYQAGAAKDASVAQSNAAMAIAASQFDAAKTIAQFQADYLTNKDNAAADLNKFAVQHNNDTLVALGNLQYAESIDKAVVLSDLIKYLNPAAAVEKTADPAPVTGTDAYFWGATGTW